MEPFDFRSLVKHVGTSRDFIRQHAERCTGCGNCEKICPMSLWQVKKSKAVLASNYKEKCVECGSCWLVCKADAIDFRYPDGGMGVVWEYG